MMTVTINNEKNGIEIRFESKPETNILEKLKTNGFRWSVKQKMWYAKITEARMTFIKNFNDVCFTEESQPEQHDKYDLWEMTRTDTIENNFLKYHIYSTKEITAIIRKHLKTRFPMCKWTISKDGNSIDVHILVSPFAIDSEELKAIVHYAYTFAQSYNKIECDPYNDYCDAIFYGVYKQSIVQKYNYTQREKTVAEKEMSESFVAAKENFDRAESERKAKEYEEAKKREEAERIEAQKRAEKRKEDVNLIESSFTCIDVDYFVMNVKSPKMNKSSSIEEILDYDEYRRENCKIAKEIHFSKDVYDLFINYLLEDFTFLAGMGGTATDDRRIQSMMDYEQMDKEERATVEWYNNNCAAIFCDNELKLVVNPEGYSYARYTFIVDNETKVVNEYQGKSGISEEDYQHNLEIAKTLEEAGISLIISTNLGDKWDTENYSKFRRLMAEWIHNHPTYKPTSDVVRAITDTRFKAVMYRIITQPEKITEQFIKAGLFQGQKVTIVKFSDFGGLINPKITINSIEYGKYAQYDEAVKLTYKPEKARSLYYNWYHNGSPMLVFAGWIDIPESLLWKEIPSNNPNVLSMKKTRFLSCDRKQFDVILDYFNLIGIRPIINTYKPQF